MSGILFLYIVCLNLVTFVIMFADKRRAIKHQWRIPEKTILLLSLIGGSLGSLCGMFVFRHKTKHLSFRILLPLFFIFHIVVVFWVVSGDLF